jgi:hypothetical protein
VPFRDPSALGAAITMVLDKPRLRESLETAAYKFGRNMTWPKIALGYRATFLESLMAGLGIVTSERGA